MTHAHDRLLELAKGVHDAHVSLKDEALVGFRNGCWPAEITSLILENRRLRDALSDTLWMAEEWYTHGGDETTFADEYEAKLKDARAALTPEPKP